MTWRSFWSWVVAVALVSPLSWRLFVVQGKPADVIPSDVLLLALPIWLWRPWRCADNAAESLATEATWMRRIVIGLVLYCGVLALVGWLQSGDGTRLLSAAKFIKPLLFVWIGGWWAHTVGPADMLRRIGWCFAGTTLVWGVSTVGNDGFPETAWGSHWLGLPVLGFPNTAMTFAAVMLPLLLAVAESTKNRLPKGVAALAAMVTFVLVVCSLSRCAAVVLFSGMTVYLLLTGGRWISLAFVGVAVLYVGTGYSLLVLRSDMIGVDHPTLQERAAHRFVRPVNPDSGALAGRSAIWNETWALIAARPLWGYAFEPYSRRAAFDTPHQQYLEVAYKTGFIGFALYLGIFWMALKGLVRLGGAAVDDGSRIGVGGTAAGARFRGRAPTPGRRRGLRTFLRPHKPCGEAQRLSASACAILCGVLLGNLSQANLTYSLTGNCVFLIVGLMIRERCVAYPAAPGSCPESIRLGNPPRRDRHQPGSAVIPS